MADTVAQKSQPALEQELSELMQSYISIAGRGESVRRRDDRIGGRLWNGQHWVGIVQPRDRAAITANVFQALVHHIVSIMVKQNPIPVVEAMEPGNQEAAQHLRSVIHNLWREDDMAQKVRRALILAFCLRTSAGKVLWDPTLHGGAGQITTDIIPGWQLILDGRVSRYELMQFCGDRAIMSRDRAMAFYPKAAQKILDNAPAAYRRSSQGQSSTPPVRDPWATGPAGSPGGTRINNKPTVVAFTGDPGFAAERDDLVEVSEIYHRDLSLYEDIEVMTDAAGRSIDEVLRDDEGLPVFEEGPPEVLRADDMEFEFPTYKLVMQPKTKKVHKRKYPHWRRTTLLSPDGILLDDRAWDGPMPYFFFALSEPMVGIWSRGPALQLETLQAMLNVSESIITDNLRRGSLQAWFASPQSGLAQKTLYLAPGQVIEADPRQVEPVPVPQIAEAWFTHRDSLIALMEKVIGAEGIMQGSAANAPRTDSAAGFDTLAEIGGSRIVEYTQRFERSVADWASIVGWFAQKYYTEKHAISVEDAEGNPTWENMWGPLLAGSFTYGVEVGSTMAWSESAKYQRNLQLWRDGAIDRIEFYKRIGLSGWKEMMKRMEANPQLSAPPPPPPKARQKKPPPQR